MRMFAGKTLMGLLAVCVSPGLVGCDDEGGSSDKPMVTPDMTKTLAMGESGSYVISGLDNGTAYRVTLVVAENVARGADGMGTFTDANMDGIADPGNSQGVAVLTMVNGAAVTPGRTFPAGTDDPANPTGIMPQNGKITFDVEGAAPGSVYAVAYVNGGASTFLELNADLTSKETHTVSQAIMVSSPAYSPATEQSIAVGATQDFGITGLRDGQAYRVTLVVKDNIAGVAGGTGTFTDGNMDNVADAGDSQNIAVIAKVNGADITPGRTFPAGTDDPAAPTGIMPVNGRIDVTLKGVAAGSVYIVAYDNGGASTFLELDETKVPVETHAVSAAVTVTQ